MASKLVSYAMDFASFLVQKTKFNDKIKNIVLFGSAARGEASADSDIDIFVDVIEENKKLEEDIKKCLEDFLGSAKYTHYWKMLDVKNEIKLTIGILKDWKQLQSSIIANGITLYSKFKTQVKEGTYKTLFVWENIKPNSKRVLFNKQLIGYKQQKHFYKGLIQKYGGERLGKGSILVPLEHSNIFHDFFKKNKITVKIKKFLEY